MEKHLKRSLSNTTELILIWYEASLGIVNGPFWSPERGYNRGIFWYLKKYSSHKSLTRIH